MIEKDLLYSKKPVIIPGNEDRKTTKQTEQMQILRTEMKSLVWK